MKNISFSKIGTALAFSTACVAVQAGPVASGFTNGGTLLACDDCSQTTSLGFSANFFGTDYTNVFINNNGSVSFGTSLASWSPTGFSSGYLVAPTIAAFMADVDTRFGGSVTYGTGTYNGGSAFGVTWNGVKGYSTPFALLNTFQIILADNAATSLVGDFDIYFNYDQIQWDQGAASPVSAAAGFAAGTGAAGTYSQLAGSLVSGAFIDGGVNALSTNTNSGVTGQYKFSMTQGTEPLPPISTVPEPGSLALMGLALFAAASTCRKSRRI